MKKCKKCSIEKPLEEFGNEKKNKDGKRGICKECTKKKFEDRAIKRIVPYSTKKCKTCFIEKPLEEFRAMKKNKDGTTGSCRICVSEKWRIKRKENPKPDTEKTKLYKLNYGKEYSKKNYRENREKLLENQKQYQKDNLEKRVDYNNSYVKKRKKEDPIYRFQNAIRANITQAFIRRKINGSVKTKNSERILGCSIDDFRLYIQSLFQEGMTLENYGDWELDHIIPISSVNTEEEVEKLCHYTNYQPLWWEENLKKGNKIITE